MICLGTRGVILLEKERFRTLPYWKKGSWSFRVAENDPILGKDASWETSLRGEGSRC